MRQVAGSTASRWVPQRLLREFLFVSRFGLVGLAATAVHMLIVWLLIAMITVPILVANLIAFLTAFGVSFTGNYVWTFAAPGSPKSAMCRFFLISSGAFAANTVLLALLARSEWLTPAVAALCAAAVIPLITYVASRLWGFKAGRPSV